MLTEDIAKVFRISAYILLYLFATMTAGIIGRAATFVAEKWILEKILKNSININLYHDWIEISRPICILTCVTGFLIVALGLLFQHLVGLLPPEYDEVAVQIVVAFFGLLVFVIMALVITLLVTLGLWLVLRWKGRAWDKAGMHEEARLLKHPTTIRYGSDRRDEAKVEEDDRRMTGLRHPASCAIQSCQPPGRQLKEPDRSWIKMTSLSSVRNIDRART